MKCIRPTQFKSKGAFNRCGQCMPCRITKRAEWTTRLVLEYRFNNNLGAFVTLTYAPEHLRDCDKYKGGNLHKPDLQKFIKRFRKHLGTGKRISYYAVGEYGGRSGRAHYHLCIFGLEAPLIERLVSKSWKLGLTQTDDLAKDGFNRMKYTLGYTLKKLTSESAVKKHIGDNREPEFSLMSRHPPLGVSIMPAFVERLKKHNLFPQKGLDLKQRYFMERHYPHITPWQGIFKLHGKTMLMDKYLQTQLFKLMYPEVIKKYVEFNKDSDISCSKLFDNYVHNRSYFSYRDQLIFMTGEEYVKAKNRSDKETRKYNESKDKQKL